MQVIPGICADCRQILTRIVTLWAVSALVSGCQPAADSAPVAVFEPVQTSLCGDQGYLSTELFGALATTIEWTAEDLECEGMPRPGGDGVRLRFAGNVADARQIAIIIALPALRRGGAGKELHSKVTLIEEGAGRFFSTGEQDICWTDIDALDSIADSDAKFAVSGTLYCVAPLTEVNGDSDITFRDLRFRGLLDWNAS